MVYCIYKKRDFFLIYCKITETVDAWYTIGGEYIKEDSADE